MHSEKIIYPFHLCFVLYNSHPQKQLYLPHYFHTSRQSDHTCISEAALLNVTHRSIRLYSMFSGHYIHKFTIVRDNIHRPSYVIRSWISRTRISPRKIKKGEKSAKIFSFFITYVRSSVTLLPRQFYGCICRCVSIKRQETQMYSCYRHWSLVFLCFSTSLFPSVRVSL